MTNETPLTIEEEINEADPIRWTYAPYELARKRAFDSIEAAKRELHEMRFRDEPYWSTWE